MSPTSRNTLMIGGALVLIALLLVCGPLSGQFGSGGSNVEEAPAVAAGPPADHSGVLGAAAVGALAGASLGESGAELLAAEASVVEAAPEAEDQADTQASFVAPAVAVVAAGTATATAVAAGGIGGGSGLGSPVVAAPLGKVEFASPVAAELPPVGAAGPSISDVMDVAASPGLGAGVTVAGFDRAMAVVAKTKKGVGMAGKVVNRFAPPVAAPPQANLNVASPLNVGVLIRPCDTPGSGCRNLAAAGGNNPPIIPGRLPPPSSGAE